MLINYTCYASLNYMIRNLINSLEATIFIVALYYYYKEINKWRYV